MVIVCKRILQSARDCWWRVLGDRLGWARLIFEGHREHWRLRRNWMNDIARVENLQRVMCGIPALLGTLMAFNLHDGGGSALVSVLDGSLNAPAWKLHLHILPHQLFGLVLVICNLLAVLSLFEWPIEGKAITPDNQWEQRRMVVLLRWQLLGHQVDKIYYVSVGTLAWLSAWPERWTFSSAETFLLFLPPWGAAAFALTHHWLYRRANGEFVREMAHLERQMRTQEQSTQFQEARGRKGAGMCKGALG